MAARQGFLLAIALSALMVVWWALSGPSALTTVCKATTPLTPYRGPFSSLCLSHYLSTGSTDFKGIDLGLVEPPGETERQTWQAQ